MRRVASDSCEKLDDIVSVGANALDDTVSTRVQPHSKLHEPIQLHDNFNDVTQQQERTCCGSGRRRVNTGALHTRVAPRLLATSTRCRLDVASWHEAHALARARLQQFLLRGGLVRGRRLRRVDRLDDRIESLTWNDVTLCSL